MKKIRKRIIKFVAITLVLIPCTTFALFGSEEAVLTAMLTELKSHTLTLFDLFDGIFYLDSQVARMRENIEDIVDLRTWDLIDRNEFLDSLIPDEILYENPVTRGMATYEELAGRIENVWGSTLNNAYGDLLKFKDYVPTYTLGQTALIADEARGFAHMGRNLLDDLDGVSEGKATVRSAQASALQVQQLAQIESNQALQISLQSQQVLSDNQVQKGIHELSSIYLQMLKNNFDTLTEE